MLEISILKLNCNCNFRLQYAVFVLTFTLSVCYFKVEIFGQSDQYISFLSWIFNTFYHIYKIRSTKLTVVED